MEVLTPQPLRQGDRIAICAPSSIIKPQCVYEAMDVLRDQGWDPYVTPNTFDRFGTYSGTDRQRGDDVVQALSDPSTRAIICARGGYGFVHLLERLDSLDFRSDPKWVVGYSDISAFHALMTRHGIASLHAPMTKHIATHKGEDEDSQRLFAILRGELPPVEIEPNEFDRRGKVTAPVTGGNLAVIAGLFATPFDVIKPGNILFIEDIAEPVYKVERIMYQLRLNGVLGKLGGLIVGHFTDYKPDADFESMEGMISAMLRGYDYPVAFGMPLGHVDHNIPMPCALTATLDVISSGATLTWE